MAPRKTTQLKINVTPAAKSPAESSPAVSATETVETAAETIVAEQTTTKDVGESTLDTDVVITAIVKKERGTNYSAGELKCLAKSWAETSIDPEEGTDMKQDAFWARVKIAFDRDYAAKERTAESLART